MPDAGAGLPVKSRIGLDQTVQPDGHAMHTDHRAAAPAPAAAPHPPDELFGATDLACTVAGRPLWHGLGFSLRAGESLGIAGASGAGKTLLLRTLAGLRPAEHGQIRLAGKRMQEYAMPAYRARVVYLAQRPALPEGRVRDALAAPFALRVHRGQRFEIERARGMLRELGVEASFLEQSTAELSGGQAQIAALVRALLIDPAVLLLDEPTASLDADRSTRVEALLQAWRTHEHPHDGPRGCLWVSHDQAQLARTCTRVLRLEDAP